MSGNIFNHVTSIQKENIEPTLKEFFKEFKTIFPVLPEEFYTAFFYLGSTGKKDISGDIDLGIDEKWLNPHPLLDILPSDFSEPFYNKMELLLKRSKTSTPVQIGYKAILQVLGEYINQNSSVILVELKKTTTSTIHLSFPQYNKEGIITDKFVQIDINTGKEDWLRFAYYSETFNGGTKGLHRTQLIVALCKIAGLSFSHASGVKDLQNSSFPVINNTGELLKELGKRLNTTFDIEYFYSFDRLFVHIMQHITIKQQNELMDVYLKILDSTRCDIPQILHSIWRDKKDKLSLTGKFLPNDSNLKTEV